MYSIKNYELKIKNWKKAAVPEAGARSSKPGPLLIFNYQLLIQATCP
ncbi:hypothetical protein J0X19_03545 [Hymenobacter sp. BT186]|uniref:Uncharacterized protein n=1 Tax=Hymenobacter telluris TaxID=2816474 RepID=A0A939EW59_9BACT|nr:hypothetical protein [Hymenobacter telluris]MBW3373035.1 hypothetical protein [Hymenobacter norwichensis]